MACPLGIEFEGVSNQVMSQAMTGGGLSRMTPIFSLALSKAHSALLRFTWILGPLNPSILAPFIPHPCGRPPFADHFLVQRAPATLLRWIQTPGAGK